jgi:phage-related protein
VFFPGGGGLVALCQNWNNTEAGLVAGRQPQGGQELRIHAENEYRLIYVAKFEDAVYVLHAFTKKTRETSLQDVRLAQRRYREMIVRRGMG